MFNIKESLQQWRLRRLKAVVALVSTLLTACATTVPPPSKEECAAQRQYILERDAQLKVRKEVVEKQLNMRVPSELVREFNEDVAALEKQANKYNAKCVRKG